MWLIYWLNGYWVSWPNCCFLCYYMFTFSQLFILEPAFCDSGEAWETKAFYKQEAGRGQGIGGCLSQKTPLESCLVTRCAVITQIHSFPLERSGSVIRKGLYARRHSIKDPKESLYFRRGILIYTRLKDSHWWWWTREIRLVRRTCKKN